MKRYRRRRLAAVLAASLFLLGRSTGADEVTGRETALTINGEAHTLAEFNYYFNAWYASFTEDNAAYLPYMFDESKSLKEQEYEEDRSWFDFFLDESVLSMEQVLTVSGAARQAGFTISSAGEAQIGDVKEAAAAFAEALDMKIDDYLAYFYGEGMDEELFTTCLRDARMAQEYTDQVRTESEISQEEIEDWYEVHTRDYTTVSYERFFARASGMGTISTPEEKEAALALARQVFAQTEAGETLQEAAAAHSGEGTYVSFDDASYIEGSVYGNWLFDPRRQAGDMELVEEVNGWYVMVFRDRNEADYPTVHVLDAYFPLDTSLDSTDEQLEASCLQAEAFKEDWEKKGGSRSGFAEAAGEQAMQTGQTYEYTALTKDIFGKSINAWAFAPERRKGDCEVLYSEDGFHVMYYLETSVEAWRELVKSDLQEAACQTWFADLMEASEVVRYDDVLSHAGGY